MPFTACSFRKIGYVSKCPLLIVHFPVQSKQICSAVVYVSFWSERQAVLALSLTVFGHLRDSILSGRP